MGMMASALIAIANGTEEMEAVIVIDLLRRANIAVTVAGESTLVTCSRGVKMIPDVTIEELSDDDTYDAVILPGGGQGVDALGANHALEHLVRRHHKAGKYIAAVCAAPTLLHDWKLLPAAAVVTAYPGTESVLAPYTYVTDRVAVDGRFITSRGPGTTIEFSLEIIRRLVGETTAARVAGDIVMYE